MMNDTLYAVLREILDRAEIDQGDAEVAGEIRVHLRGTTIVLMSVCVIVLVWVCRYAG